MNGAGCAGLVSVACFADFDQIVSCVDKDKSKIKRIESGECSLFEPARDHLIICYFHEAWPFFAKEGAKAIKTVDGVFNAVGTQARRGPD